MFPHLTLMHETWPKKSRGAVFELDIILDKEITFQYSVEETAIALHV